jgi:hypothetical protein
LTFVATFAAASNNQYQTVMKKILFVLTGAFMALFTQAQMKTLFVNDNSVNPANTTSILETIAATGFEYDLFDAVAESRSPVLAEMEAYDLVIWYMSSDGVGRYFWNGDDSDNPEIVGYLTRGGWMWVIGTDFMYDRYSTPTFFEGEDFPLKFLGVQEYHAQSYADDGLQGVPQLDLAPEQKILTLDPVYWMFPTLWYADAMVVSTKAAPIYYMGPEEYVFSDFASAIYSDYEAFKVLSFFFDPALMDNEDNRLFMFKEVIGFFFQHVGIQSNTNTDKYIKVFPNPASDVIFIRIETSSATDIPVVIHDIRGRVIHESVIPSFTTELSVNSGDWSPGVYVISCGSQRTRIVTGHN